MGGIFSTQGYNVFGKDKYTEKYSTPFFNALDVSDFSTQEAYGVFLHEMMKYAMGYSAYVNYSAIYLYHSGTRMAKVTREIDHNSKAYISQTIVIEFLDTEAKNNFLTCEEKLGPERTNLLTKTFDNKYEMVDETDEEDKNNDMESLVLKYTRIHH